MLPVAAQGALTYNNLAKRVMLSILLAMFLLLDMGNAGTGYRLKTGSFACMGIKQSTGTNLTQDKLLKDYKKLTKLDFSQK